MGAPAAKFRKRTCAFGVEEAKSIHSTPVLPCRRYHFGDGLPTVLAHPPAAAAAVRVDGDIIGAGRRSFVKSGSARYALGTCL